MSAASLLLSVGFREALSVSTEYKVILLIPLLFSPCTNAPFDSLVFKVCMCKSVFVDLNTCPLPSCYRQLLET